MPNPIEIIKEDHEMVKNLFTTYNGYTENDNDQKKDTAHEILKSLTVHARMEEKYFYPRLKEKIDAEHPIPVDEAEAEHHAAKMLIMELKLMPVASDNYDAKMSVLEENILHHIEEEESELLPQAKEVLTDDMDQIGQQMFDYRENARKDLLDKLLGEE
jgi:hemerythrin-like domain-containing protein